MSAPPTHPPTHPHPHTVRASNKTNDATKWDEDSYVPDAACYVNAQTTTDEEKALSVCSEKCKAKFAGKKNAGTDVLVINHG